MLGSLWALTYVECSYKNNRQDITALLLASLMIWTTACSTYELLIIVVFFHSVGGCKNVCNGWRAPAVLPALVSWVFIEPHFLGWPAGGSHTYCYVRHTHTHACWKKPPLPFTFAIYQVCAMWWSLFVDTLYWECIMSDSLCASVWCWCYLCQRCMAEDHTKWLIALIWPKSFFAAVSLHCLCVKPASQLC